MNIIRENINSDVFVCIVLNQFLIINININTYNSTYINVLLYIYYYTYTHICTHTHTFTVLFLFFQFFSFRILINISIVLASIICAGNFYFSFSIIVSLNVIHSFPSSFLKDFFHLVFVSVALIYLNLIFFWCILLRIHSIFWIYGLIDCFFSFKEFFATTPFKLNFSSYSSGTPSRYK